MFDMPKFEMESCRLCIAKEKYYFDSTVLNDMISVIRDGSTFVITIDLQSKYYKI
jgi:hypothetical protein